MALVRPMEAAIFHAMADGSTWYGATRDLTDLSELLRSVRTADEEDITEECRDLDFEAASTPLHQLFGGTLLSITDAFGCADARLLARDSVERAWLAWRFERGRVIFVEETPGFFDRHLHRLSEFAREPVFGPPRTKPRCDSLPWVTPGRSR
jgi:hypothetical protein